MEITCSKGDRIILRDNRSQVFVGNVKSVNRDLGRILLSNVVQLPEKVAIEGYRNFDRNEIVELRSCDKEEDDKQTTSVETSSGKESLDSNRLEEIEKLQREFRFIKDFGTNFQAAVSHLKGCKMVGVRGEDVSRGRCGRASVLALSTSSHVFVFDIQTLGDEAFEKGLREVLESGEVAKVAHDSRLLSDCLRHKHLVRLENVLDVEAEDVMVVLQERRTIRKHARPLPYLLKLYLGVDAEESEAAEGDWSLRPLPPRLLRCTVALVSFLLPLQEAVRERFLRRLLVASAVYASHLRGLDFFGFVHSDQSRTPLEELRRAVAPRERPRGELAPRKLPPSGTPG